MQNAQRKILMLGANGFIGHHLTRQILETTNWELVGLDIDDHRLTAHLDHPRFRFVQADMTRSMDLIADLIRECDTVIPLVAIATPESYTREPLRVFELDFEANLPIVRLCAEHGKRIIFPSTSEVYGMSNDAAFDPESTNLVLGPINKTRWIYSCSKQLMDRVIWAYGQEQGLDFTLFRPFNWVGPGQDSLNDAQGGKPRVMAQFLSNIAQGRNLSLVDGGLQQRSFTYIQDGIAALMAIIANRGGIASGKIYNIGNPDSNISIRELAERVLTTARQIPECRVGANVCKLVETSSDSHYGAGYQDVQHRVPDIANTRRDLDWAPQFDINATIDRTVLGYADEIRQLFGSELQEAAA